MLFTPLLQLTLVLKSTTPRRAEWSDEEFDKYVRDDASRLMKLMDTDGSGTVDFDEFQEATKHLRKIRAERVASKLLGDVRDAVH
jgi:Ca2+-binding EF-hand superfamily protein